MTAARVLVVAQQANSLGGGAYYAASTLGLPLGWAAVAGVGAGHRADEYGPHRGVS